jgi:hypothetical protein
MSKAKVTLSRADALRVAAHSGADLRTVQRYFTGDRMQRVAALAIKRACSDLKIDAPSHPLIEVAK